MKSARVLLLLPLLAGAAPAAWAQEPLTLDQAVESALAQNATVRAARASVEEAAAQADAARSAFFPRLSITEAWQRGNQPGFVFSSLLSARRFAAENFAIDALNHPSAIGFFRATVAVDQIVFDAGRRASTQAAAARRELADASAAEAALAVSVAATEMFGRVVAAQAAGRAARAARDAGRDDLSHTQNRRDAGMATDADVLALLVHVADVERRLIQADGEAAVARAELNRLMGVSIDREFQVVEPQADPLSRQETDARALLREADASRPDLQRVATAERLAQWSRREARAAFVPTIAAHAAFDANGLRFNDRAGGWFVGGELRWSFSTGGGELAQLRAASSAVTRAQAERDEVRAAAHVDVVAALRRLEAAQARQAAGRAAVEQAREAERIVRDRYEAGIASVNDVLRAATAVLDAEANRSSALVESLVSNARLNRALGRRPS